MSQRNMNVFCSDLMVSEFFKFLQTDYPRWPLGAITKDSINTKMQISQEPLVGIDPTLCQNVSCIKFLFFAIWHSKIPAVCHF